MVIRALLAILLLMSAAQAQSLGLSLSGLDAPRKAGASGPTSDPFFSSVTLLMHFNGTDGSTVYTDNSQAPHSFGGSGGIALTTSQAKYGNASLQNTLGGGWIGSSDSLDWHIGGGQFTVECFVRPTTAPVGIRGLVTQWAGVSDLSWGLAFNGNTLNFNYSTTGTDLLLVGAAYTPPVNQWVHVAADRDASNVLRVYADGVVIASGTVTVMFFNSTRTLQIANDENGTRGFLGQIDEVRITKGVARYGGAFFPPTGQFPDS